MIAYGRYCFFKDKEDFLTHTNCRADFYIFEEGIIEEIPNTFPVTFCYADSIASGFYGTWVEVDSIELIELLRGNVNILNSMIENIMQSS